MRNLLKNSFANLLFGVFFRKLFGKNISNNKERKLFHSRRAKIKTIALIFGLIGLIIAVYVLYFAIKEKRFSNNDISIGEYDISKNAFKNFFYKTGDSSGKEIIISAEKVTEEKKDYFIFEKVKSSFSLADGDNGIITSKNGKVTLGSKNTCEFKNNVVMTTKSGMLLRTEEAIFDSGKKNIFGNSQVTIDTKGTKLSADNYNFDTTKNILFLNKNAKVLSNNYKINSDELIIEINKEYQNSIKTFTAKKNASLLSEGYDLSAEKSIVYRSNSDKKFSEIDAEKNVTLVYRKKKNNDKSGDKGKNNQSFIVQSNKMHAILGSDSKISEVIADGSVKIKTQDSVIKADRGVYKKNTVTVLGNVVILKKEGNIFGEIAELDLDTGAISIKKSSGILMNSKG